MRGNSHPRKMNMKRIIKKGIGQSKGLDGFFFAGFEGEEHIEEDCPHEARESEEGNQNDCGHENEVASPVLNEREVLEFKREQGDVRYHGERHEYNGDDCRNQVGGGVFPNPGVEANPEQGVSGDGESAESC